MNKGINWKRGLSQCSSVVKNLPGVQVTYEAWVWSLGWEDPQEKEMATHSSILVWEISWTEKTGGLQSVGVTKSWTCLNTHTHTHTHTLNKTIIELVTHGICCSSCFREVTSSFYYIVSVRVHRINKFLTTTVSVSAFLEFGFHYN